MNIIIGKSRNRTAEPDKERSYDVAMRVTFTLGIVMLCAFLVYPMFQAQKERVSGGAAIAVMSGGMEETREELVMPDEAGEDVMSEKWSFYDYIGDFFAYLIRGE